MPYSDAAGRSRGPITIRKTSSKRRNAVRIIGGRWRGRRIEITGGTAVRPTPDRVRETVFNWLAPTIAGASCLDLYAGTGVLGLEALSRGAQELVFVERDRRLAGALRTQLEALGASARVIEAEAKAYLSAPTGRRFDIVFLDPPYADVLELALGRLGPWLCDTATVYVERSRDQGELDALLTALPGTRLAKQARAGDVVYGLLAYEQP